ncbi:MAG: YeeE/YedE family protein [Alphaproteobacteria bacterium]
MENFTPVSALIGGGLIGLATAIYLLGLGRVAGISGIVGGLLRPAAGDVPVYVAFLVGLAVAPRVVEALGTPLPPLVIDASLPALIVGGLLVGFGTRLGGGCTSGHGVCGIARLSPRSLAATAIFMAAGAAAVFVARHVAGG